ncbi:hypothetical protein GPALN_005759 [Globodera pallida]|nr:hypothetical protein GPALN_005759 [Globodera pallida]
MADVSAEAEFDLHQSFNDTIYICAAANDWRRKVCCKWIVLMILIFAVGGYSLNKKLLRQTSSMLTEALEGEREFQKTEEAQKSIQLQNLSQQIEQQTHILKSLVNEQYSANFWKLIAISTLAIALFSLMANRCCTLLLPLLKLAISRKFWKYPIFHTLIVFILLNFMEARNDQMELVVETFYK